MEKLGLRLAQPSLTGAELGNNNKNNNNSNNDNNT